MNKGLELLKTNPAVHKFFVDYGKQIKKTAAISILIIVALLFFAAKDGEGSIQQVSGSTAASENADDNGVAVSEDGALTDENGQTVNPSGTLFVDIGGAVVEPKLAELPSGSRVEDAILAAGGLTEEADLTQINRAEFVTDGEKIYIPTVDEVQAAAASEGSSQLASSSEDISSVNGASAASSSSGSSGKVNINTADSSQLQTLTGIGPVTAQKIIDYRQSNGGFNTIEDIKNVSGIGDKTFEKLKNSITTK